MKLFDKPKWLKPELNEPKYWFHLLILSLVIFGVSKILFNLGVFTLTNIIAFIPILAFGDMIAHTILRLD